MWSNQKFLILDVHMCSLDISRVVLGRCTYIFFQFFYISVLSDVVHAVFQTFHVWSIQRLVVFGTWISHVTFSFHDFGPMVKKDGGTVSQIVCCMFWSVCLPPLDCPHRHARSVWPQHFSGSSFCHGQTPPAARSRKYHSSRYLEEERHTVMWMRSEFMHASHGFVGN